MVRAVWRNFKEEQMFLTLACWQYSLKIMGADFSLSEKGAT